MSRLPSEGPHYTDVETTMTKKTVTKRFDRRRLTNWGKRAFGVASTLGAFFFVGCNKYDRHTFDYPNDHTVTHYDEHIQQTEYAQPVENVRVDDPRDTPSPRSLADHIEGDPFGKSFGARTEPTQYEPIQLEAVIRKGLENSKVMRDLGGSVLRSPDSVQTRFASAIQYTDPRFGPEAALSNFDAQFRTSGNFENNDRDLNNSFFGGGTNSLVQDLNVYQTEISKRTATGAQFALRNNVDYDNNNAPGNLFDHAWNMNMEAEVRQPLLQGAGTQFNRIAGPFAVPGFINGYEIAKVNNNITEVEFEIGLRNFVSDLINAYWDLYFAYRDLDAKIEARDVAIETWRAQKVAQDAAQKQDSGKVHLAAEQYYRFQDEVQNALAGRPVEGTQTTTGTSGGNFRAAGGVYQAERRLRLLMGLPATDGTLLRPSSDACSAPIAFDWEAMKHEALERRPEIRRQKLRLKRREKELIASRNFLSPRFDAVAQYRWRGFGNDLYQPDATSRKSDAVHSLIRGDNQEWQMGVEFSVPLGFRRGHAAVQNAELQVSKERAVLREQERQIIHDLSTAVSELDRSYLASKTNMNRYYSARDLYVTLKVNEEGVDRLLDAQRRMVEAKSRYFQSLSEYSIAIKNVNFQKGSVLDYYDIYLAEHGGPPDSPEDADVERLPIAPIPGSFDEGGNAKPLPNQPNTPQPKTGTGSGSPKVGTPQEKYDDKAPKKAPVKSASGGPQLLRTSAQQTGRRQFETPADHQVPGVGKRPQPTGWKPAPQFVPRQGEVPHFEDDVPLFDGDTIDPPELDDSRVGRVILPDNPQRSVIPSVRPQRDA